jgi:hypothetical protein
MGDRLGRFRFANRRSHRFATEPDALKAWKMKCTASSHSN